MALAVNDFPGLGGGGDSQPARSEPARAAAPFVPAATASRFDALRAMAFAREQVEGFGPRPAGSDASRRLAARLRGLLPQGRFETVPGGLRNVVGRLPGRLPAIVIGAHYDTAPVFPGYLGANDGAAGSAALVELARVLRHGWPRSAPELRFVAFDGEELPPGDSESNFMRDALRGSKAYVRAHPRSTREMLLLDYIANRGLRLPRELSSTPALWGRLRAAADRVGVARVFPSASQGDILDDHTPFLQARVPSVDLIDFSYRYAHTHGDTFDKLSTRSMDAVGETMVEYLRSRR